MKWEDNSSDIILTWNNFSDNSSDFLMEPSSTVGVVELKTLTANESAFYIMSENWTIY